MLNDTKFENNNIFVEKESKLINNLSIIYKINDNNRKIQIFGYDFVEKNKRKFKMIINEEVKEICTYFEIHDKIIEKQLIINLEQIKPITSLSHIFYDCSSLVSIL